MPDSAMPLTLVELGFDDFFARQIGPREAGQPARVIGVWRRSLTVATVQGDRELHLGGRWFQLPAEQRPTIGDWVLLTENGKGISRLLRRRSLLVRRAAGRHHELQLLAANVDTMFVVTSCNEEFNQSRIERYLALALEAGVQPVLVLTKADLTDAPADFAAAARGLMRDVPVEVVDARDPATLVGVRAWCGTGHTVVLLGSSGVGKSTLVNSLAGESLQETGAIRSTDAKGRHTTTHRSLHRLPDGGLLVDNPGMRELTLADVDAGAAELFADVLEFAAECRFADCRHLAEPGCAVREAIESGRLEPRRLESFRKLVEGDPAAASAIDKVRPARNRGRRGRP